MVLANTHTNGLSSPSVVKKGENNSTNHRFVGGMDEEIMREIDGEGVRGEKHALPWRDAITGQVGAEGGICLV